MTTAFSAARRRLFGIAALPFVRDARAADVDRFALGVASGPAPSGGVVLWTRLVGPDLPERVAVRWEVADDETFARVVAHGADDAVHGDAHTVHAEVGGLDASRWYFYRFSAFGAQSATGRTRTAPAAGAVEPLRFAVASCQRWDHGLYAAWRHLADDEAPDLIVFVGDYIYEAATPPGAQRIRAHAGGPLRTVDDYRARYAQYRSDPLLRRAHAAAPWLAVWDDHEVENDYAGMQSSSLDPAFPARRAAAYRAYWEHMPFPRSMRPQRGALGLYRRLDWGRLARFHALDDRQYRDPQACPKPGRGGSNTVLLADCPALADPRRSLLGAAQERWLDGGWSAGHRWNLVAQQTLMSRFDWRDPARDPAQDPRPTWTDGWDGYAPARRRLLEGVAARGLRNVVVVGGDVHAHYVCDLKADFDDPRAPVVATEFCGTSISSEGLAQARVDAALPFNPHIRWGRSDRRGYIGFDVGATRLEARLMAVDDPLDAASAVRVAARFAVAAGRPGAEAM